MGLLCTISPSRSLLHPEVPLEGLRGWQDQDAGSRTSGRNFIISFTISRNRGLYSATYGFRIDYLLLGTLANDMNLFFLVLLLADALSYL